MLWHSVIPGSGLEQGVWSGMEFLTRYMIPFIQDPSHYNISTCLTVVYISQIINNAPPAQHFPSQKPPPTQPQLPPQAPTETPSHITLSTSSSAPAESPQTRLSRASRHESSCPFPRRRPSGHGGGRGVLRGGRISSGG